MMTEGVTALIREARDHGPGLQRRAHAGQRRSLGGACVQAAHAGSCMRCAQLFCAPEALLSLQALQKEG